MIKENCRGSQAKSFILKIKGYLKMALLCYSVVRNARKNTTERSRYHYSIGIVPKLVL